MVSIRESEFYKKRLDDGNAKETIAEAKEKLNTLKDTDIKQKVTTLYRFVKSGSYKVKLLAIAALIYFIQPFDLLPDSIPLIGYADDLVVMSVALSEIFNLHKSMTAETE